ncbi:MAG: MFS transporter [Hyphomicrobiales bacterium]
MTTAEDISMNDDPRARRNARIYALGQALYGAHTVTLITTGGLIGKALSSDPSLATLPISAFVFGTMITAIPASWWMRQVGRRVGFMTGAFLGFISAICGLLAILNESFVAFTLAMVLTGAYQAFSMLYRFAATDLASPSFKAKAIAWVTIGGLAAAFLGPAIVISTKNLIPNAPFAGCYLTIAGLAVISALMMLALDNPDGVKRDRADTGRSLGVILRHPRLLVAIFAGMMSFGMMNLVMTATPLAMVDCGFTVDTAAIVIQWHVIAMYAPSFFTGGLINRFGVEKVISTGMFVLAAAGIAALLGLHVANFSIGLILLGVGWNFSFVGATAMVTDHYTPAEKNKVQGINDFCVFATVAVASLSSGKLLHLFGWDAVNLALFPMILITLLLFAWLYLSGRAQKPALN